MNPERPRHWIFRGELLGALVIAIGVVVLVLSYRAQNGLPSDRTYRMTVDVPDAAAVTKNSDVRIGGARVGQVLTIRAQPARGGHAPYATLGLALSSRRAGHLPVDTQTRVRLASLLGGKYLEITPGHAEETVPHGGHLGLRNSVPGVDLDVAFRAFGGPTARGIRRLALNAATALVGRGTAMNASIGSARDLLPPLQRVLETFADPRTDLTGFLRGAASATAALAPLADELDSLTRHATATLGALDEAGDALSDTIGELPPTAAVATRTLRHLDPVLDDAAQIARALRPASRVVAPATHALDVSLRASTPVLRRIPVLGRPFDRTFAAIDAFARDPASTAGIKALGSTDLPTFATSLFLGLGSIFHYTATAQLQCNTLAVWARNVASALSDGDAAGSWLTFMPLISLAQSQQATTPSADLHFNPYPTQDASACEAGNERYVDGRRVIGHPASTYGRRIDHTTRPAGVGR